MISRKTENILITLAKIEATVARVYERFAKNDSYTDAAKDFWESTVKEELEHEKLFNKIREKAKRDGSIQIEINFDTEHLRKIINGFKKILKEVYKEVISESRAYELGALIEEKLYEFGFAKRIITEDEDIVRSIRQVVDDTRRHQRMLYNYSLGERSPLRPPIGSAVYITENE
jgi:rubrerythrin